jgi:hypothetical protein
LQYSPSLRSTAVSVTALFEQALFCTSCNCCRLHSHLLYL